MSEIRFHHFHLKENGRLIATIATSPIPDDPESVLVAAAIVSRKDDPSRKRGRSIALERLMAGKAIAVEKEDLKRAITLRTIIEWFPGAQKYTADKLRPPRPWTGPIEPITAVPV